MIVVGDVRLYDPMGLEPLAVGLATAFAVCSLLPQSDTIKVCRSMGSMTSSHSSAGTVNPQDAGIIAIAWTFHRLLCPTVPLHSICLADMKTLRHHLARCVREDAVHKFPCTLRSKPMEQTSDHFTLRRESDLVKVHTAVSSGLVLCPPVSNF